MATMRGRSPRPSCARDAARGFEAVHLGHLHVHQHHVVGLALDRTRSPRCRCWPGRRGSPSAAAGAARASGSPRCPRPAGCAADGAPPCRRRSPAWPRAAPARGAASCASRLTSVSNSCDWRRLGQVGREQALGVAGLAPAERAEQHQRQRGVRAARMRRASAMPSISGMCMSRIARSKRLAARRASAAPAPATRCRARRMPHLAACSASTLRLVALSSTTSRRLPAARAARR